MSTFTDPATGKTYQMNPLTGGYTEVPGTSTSAPPAETTTTPTVSRRQQAQEFANKSLGRMQELMGGLGGLPTGRLGLGAGIIPGVTTGLSELAAGRPVGAGGAVAGAGVGGLLGAGAARLLPTTGRFGIVGKAAQVALPFLGAQFGAGQGAAAAEYARQKVTGEPTKGKEEEIASQLALQQKLSDIGLDRFRTATGIETGAVKDLSKFYSDQAYLDLQRNLPIVNQMKNADLVRQQALLASQGNQLARLSILGTAGQLATGAQSESGATLRTMLTSNPYANAVLR